MFIQLVTIRGANRTALRCCEQLRFRARWTNEIKLSENSSSRPIKLSVCSSARHIKMTFTITSEHTVKHKPLSSSESKEGLASHSHIGWRCFLAAFCSTKKRTQEIAVAINLGWPYQGWYCISFPLSETLILEIHVTGSFQFHVLLRFQTFQVLGLLLKQPIVAQC